MHHYEWFCIQTVLFVISSAVVAAEIFNGPPHVPFIVCLIPLLTLILAWEDGKECFIRLTVRAEPELVTLTEVRAFVGRPCGTTIRCAEYPDQVLHEFGAYRSDWKVGDTVPVKIYRSRGKVISCDLTLRT